MAPADRPLDRLGLPRVDRARLRLGRRLGYDAVEVMVGIDALSQQIAAVQAALATTTSVPICAVHAPCLLFTQRVWGTEPVGQARALGRDGRRRSAPTWSSCTRRSAGSGTTPPASSRASPPSRTSTGIAFAVENMYPWRASSRRGMEMYLPGWDPSERGLRQHDHRPLPRGDRAAPTSIAMAERLGPRLRHIHLTDGTGSAKDEHLVPGRGDDAAPTRSCGTWPSAGFAGHIVLEINTRKCATARSASATCVESLEFAREHFAVRTP